MVGLLRAGQLIVVNNLLRMGAEAIPPRLRMLLGGDPDIVSLQPLTLVAVRR